MLEVASNYLETVMLNNRLPLHEVLGREYRTANISYYRNMAEVRAQVEAFMPFALQDSEKFYNFLNYIHTVALQGISKTRNYTGETTFNDSSAFEGYTQTINSIIEPPIDDITSNIKIFEKTHQLDALGKYILVSIPERFDTSIELSLLPNSLLIMGEKDGHTVLHNLQFINSLQYLDQSQRIKKGIEIVVECMRLQLQEAIFSNKREGISRFIRTGCIALPFSRVNFSLFMNIANWANIQLGLPSVSHGYLDYVATRMTEPGFDIFYQEYLNQNSKRIYNLKQIIKNSLN